MRQILTLALTAFVLSGCVSDRGVPKPYSITESLEFENYKERLQGVRFYFGNQSHPPVARTIGARTVSRKASTGGNRQPNAICARALASALLRLKSAALQSGGDAVINIKSNFRHREVSSETHFQCASGVWASGVVLKGTIVKFR
jgi:uncharacterized protein YbjQ (UPF0145 family)